MGNVIDRLKDLISARQINRILRLSFPNNDGPRCELVVEKLEAFESMSRDFEFTVEILSDIRCMGWATTLSRVMLIPLSSSPIEYVVW